MARMCPPGMLEERKQELWVYRRAGESISQISVALAKPPGSVFTILRHHGGIAPTPRKRSPEILSLPERQEISRGLAAGKSLQQIARDLKRAPSPIRREVKRNKGALHYRAVDADDLAWRRANRRRPCLLAENEELRAFVAGRLADDWSPRQIAGHVAKRHPVSSDIRTSHETIYKSLVIQTRGVPKRELQQHLRSKRPIRRHKSSSAKGQRRAEIIGAVSIRERPAEVEDRAITGHWEGDLLLGRGLTQITRLAERSTRYTQLLKLNGHDMNSETDGLNRELTRLPEELRKSLTLDRGMELANHKQVSIDTGLEVYFADPRSPWQRDSSNENTNGLLRQYFPKGTSLKGFSQDELDESARKLNTVQGRHLTTTRQRLDWRHCCTESSNLP